MGVNAKLAQGGVAQHPLVYQPASTKTLADGTQVPASPAFILTDGDGNVLKSTDNGDGTFTIPMTASVTVTDQPPVNSVVLASAARTTTQTQADQTNASYKGLHFIVDVTVNGAGGSITPKVQAKDANGVYYDLLVGTAITGTGTTVLKLFPGATPVANGVSDDQLPLTYRTVITANNANAVTYSAALVLLP